MSAASGIGDSGGRGAQVLTERRRQALGPAYRLFYDRPLHLVSGEGAWLTAADGRRYLDMYNNVPHVGHCHPRVVAAISAQAATLNTHTRYLHDTVIDYAERLLATLPASIDVAMFSCTGSEANELALRIARAATGKRGVIVIEHAYHGNSQATFEISTEDIPAERRPPHVATIPAPDAYRGAHRGSDAGPRYADALVDAIQTLEGNGSGFAAFVVDTLASSSGVIEPPAGFLARAAAITRERGGLFIADEVQAGLGRTGRHFWGFEAEDLAPDIVTAGKPLGNGHPLAATFARRALVDAFAAESGYFNTFGGNPVSAAAGLAVLDVIADDGLQQHAMRIGSQLKAGLERLTERHDSIGDVRGHGLFLGVDLVEDRASREPATTLARRVINELCERGVLTSVVGPGANVIKIRPPLALSAADADLFLERIDEALTACGKMTG